LAAILHSLLFNRDAAARWYDPTATAFGSRKRRSGMNNAVCEVNVFSLFQAYSPPATVAAVHLDDALPNPMRAHQYRQPGLDMDNRQVLKFL
jgi:hypothetical protein